MIFKKEKKNEAPQMEAKVSLDDIFYALSLIMDKMGINNNQKLENEEKVEPEEKKVEETKKEEIEDTEENESVDKRQLIDEVGGILKGKVDDETIRLVMKKMEEASYNGSEDDQKVNACKNSTEEEQKETSEKELEKDLEKKEEKENSIRPVFNAIKNSIKENSLSNFETYRERIERCDKKYSL